MEILAKGLLIGIGICALVATANNLRVHKDPKRSALDGIPGGIGFALLAYFSSWLGI